MKFKTFSELVSATYELFPDATFDEVDGEIVIYTNCQETVYGEVCEYSIPDLGE